MFLALSVMASIVLCYFRLMLIVLRLHLIHSFTWILHTVVLRCILIQLTGILFFSIVLLSLDVGVPLCRYSNELFVPWKGNRHKNVRSSVVHYPQYIEIVKT